MVDLLQLQELAPLELSLCQRYYERFLSGSQPVLQGYSTTAVFAQVGLIYSTKRVNPTYSFSDTQTGVGSGQWSFLTGDGQQPTTFGTIQADQGSPTGTRLKTTNSGGYTVGQGSCLFSASADAWIGIDAEL